MGEPKKLEEPAIIKDLIKNLKVLAPDLTEETLRGVVLVNLSYALCAMRVQFKETETMDPEYPNLFVSIYLYSGMGKDTVTKRLKRNVFRGLTKFLEANEDSYKYKYLPESIEEQIKREHADWTPEKIEKEKFKRLQKERPFTLDCNSGGTEEGLYADMAGLSKRYTGAVFVQQSEAGVFAVSKKETKQSYLDRLFSGYDNRIEGRNLKEVNHPTVNNVPLCVEFLSTPDILLNDSKFKQRQKNGFARRFWIFMQTDWKKTTQLPTQLEEDTAIKNLREIGRKLFGNDLEPDKPYVFKKVMDANRKPANPKKLVKNAVLPFADGVYDRCFIPYKQKIIEKTNTIEDQQVRDALNEHPFRACKVACIYAVLNHPNDLKVTETDFRQAIKTVEETDQIITMFNYAPKEKDEFDYISEALIKEFNENKPEDGIFSSKILYDIIDVAVRPVVFYRRRQFVRNLIAGDSLDNTRYTLAENLQPLGYDLQPVIGTGNFKGFKMVKLEEVKAPTQTEEELTAGLY